MVSLFAHTFIERRRSSAITARSERRNAVNELVNELAIVRCGALRTLSESDD